LLRTKDVELRHVAEVHRQEARRLVIGTLLLRRGRAFYLLLGLCLFLVVVFLVAIVLRVDGTSGHLLRLGLHHLLDGFGRGSLDSHVGQPG
jgi:hypothetical protein